MVGRTVTRAHLAEAVYRAVGLTRSESAELVEAVMAEISTPAFAGAGSCRRSARRWAQAGTAAAPRR